MSIDIKERVQNKNFFLWTKLKNNPRAIIDLSIAAEEGLEELDYLIDCYNRVPDIHNSQILSHAVNLGFKRLPKNIVMIKVKEIIDWSSDCGMMHYWYKAIINFDEIIIPVTIAFHKHIDRIQEGIYDEITIYGGILNLGFD